MIRDVSQLHKLEQIRRDFIANVSHELRTPLTVIRGYVETLSMSQDLPDRWSSPLQQMEQQGLRMTNLINELLELSKLETAQVEQQEPVNLRSLLEKVQADAQALSAQQAHAISLECEPDLAMYGCEKELHSAFSNLVFNAVKYSPAQSAIDICAKVTALGLDVAITDKGRWLTGVLSYKDGRLADLEKVRTHIAKPSLLPLSRRLFEVVNNFRTCRIEHRGFASTPHESPRCHRSR